MRKPSLLSYVALGSLPQAFAYVGLPLLTAHRHRGRGWRDSRPRMLNVCGLLLVAGGAALIEWAIVSHFREAPDDAKPTAKPDYLVETGAYARSRNPLYLGGLSMWMGWAWFLGSRRAGVAAVVLATFLALVGVPYEERLLDAKFGDTYRTYMASVPRWL